MNHTRIEILTQEDVTSLCWIGDELVDVASGVYRYALDGSVTDPSVRFGYRFDAAVVSPSGRYAVIYERLGTKGAIVDLGVLGGPARWTVREIDRSYYFADAFAYPVAFVRDATGRELLAHCPEEYNQLEIEEIETGKRLTERGGKADDFFHSRLQVSPEGRYLLSAGWIWHPISWIGLYDINACLVDPTKLNGSLEPGTFYGEIPEATFLDQDRVAIFGGDPINGPEEGEPAGCWDVDPGHLAVVDYRNEKRLSHVSLPQPAGDMMACGDKLVTFYEHPRLIDPATGALLAEWPDLPTGRQTSSIFDSNHPPSPHIAKDPQHHRFAVALDKRIVVITVAENPASEARNAAHDAR